MIASDPNAIVVPASPVLALTQQAASAVAMALVGVILGNLIQDETLLGQIAGPVTTLVGALAAAAALYAWGAIAVLRNHKVKVALATSAPNGFVQ